MKPVFLYLHITFIGLLLALATTCNAALVCANDEFGQFAVWHVGQSHDVFNQLDSEPSDAVHCQATDQELKYITNHFTGLHGRADADVVEWHGQDAVFIIRNL